jgi:hypothetical protein
LPKFESERIAFSDDPEKAEMGFSKKMTPPAKL